MTYFAEMFQRTLDFRGKSDLKQFWFAVLYYIIFGICVQFIALPFVLDFNVFYNVAMSVSSLYEMVLFLPLLSLTVRRLHDAGKSGYYVLLSLIPIVGTIILIIYLCLQKGRVRYQLVKLAVFDDQLLQAFIVRAMDISRLTTKMLAIANASNILIMLLTPIPAIHHDGHPQLFAHRIKHLTNQSLHVLPGSLP